MNLNSKDPLAELFTDEYSIVTSTPQNIKQFNKPMFQMFEDDDENDDLGFDPQQPKARVRTNILDDLLDPISSQKTVTTAPIVSRREEKSISRQSTDTNTDTSALLARSKPTTGRRNSNASGHTNTDPLGFLTLHAKDSTAKTPVSNMSKQKAQAASMSTNWLGLNVKTVNTEIAESHTKHKNTIDDQTNNTGNEPSGIIKKNHEIVETQSDILSNSYVAAENASQNIVLLNNLNAERQNAFIALQQQESHLSLAVQMKNQEAALHEMQRKQEILLQQQEQQFQSLLQKQIQRQRQMEEHIREQQRRINTHMQILMTQPFMPTTLKENQESELNSETKTELENAPRELFQGVDSKFLHLNKLRLEDILESMKENHEREVALIESSYKKQLQIQESHFNAVEARLKFELDEIKNHFSEKFRVLEEEKKTLKVDYEKLISSLKQDHEDELRKIKDSHEYNLNMLKDDYKRMLDNVRESKLLEFAAIKENGSYVETLKLASTSLENLTGGLFELQNEMQNKIEMLHIEKERKLDARERNLEDTEKRLKMSEEAAEEEKRRLMTLVGDLELQLNNLSKTTAEENWLLRKKMSSLETEKAVFEKEKEYAREQLSREEKRLNELKDQQFNESQRTQQEVQEGKARLLVERKKIETERKLLMDHDIVNQELEIEAILKVAQDATRKADSERTRYCGLQRQLETQKRELKEKEQILSAKQDEIEQALSSFRMAEHKSQEMEQKARIAEQNLKSKMQLLQQRMRELGEKEANLSKQQMLLTQDRIALHNLKLRINERKCVLCKVAEHESDIPVKNVMDNNIEFADTKLTTNNSTINQEGNLKMGRLINQNGIVDRILDNSIAESYRKMKSITRTDFLAESVLDDDSKNLALHNLEHSLI